MATNLTTARKTWAGIALLATATAIGLWPAAPRVVSFTTHDAQHVLTAELDGQVVADRTVADAWEQWEVAPVDGGVSLKSAHGRYLAAELDGHVVADRETVGPWEIWQLVAADGGVALQSAHGCFLVAEEGGGGPVRADRCYDAPGPWETFTPSQALAGLTPTPAPAPGALVGRLRTQGGIAYVDDTGPVLPTYAHAGDLFSVFVRDRPRALGQLDAIARAGYHGVRAWLTLGCGPGTSAGCPSGAYWRGREVGPDVTPQYWAEVGAFLEALADRRLRLVASQGDVGQLRDRRAYMTQLRVQHDASPVIDWVDCGNEAWQTGEPDPARLAACVTHYGGGASLRTLTDAPIYGQVEPAPVIFDRFSVPPADAFDVHSWRGGRSWDKRRHIWGYTYCGEGCPLLKLGINSEPPGGGVRVSAIEHREEMDDEAVALLALASHLGRQAFVWFSGEGVILERGLEGEPGFAAVPRAVALLPRDVYTFRTSHHSGATFRGIRVLEPQGEVRIDGRQSDDGRFAYTVDGPAGSYRLRVARAFEGRLCDPGAGTCDDVSARAGDALPITFTRGRLFVGRIQ